MEIIFGKFKSVADFCFEKSLRGNFLESDGEINH